MGDAERNKALVQRFVDAGNGRDLDVLAELWVTWDNVDILAQLGHIDPPPPPSDS